MTAPNPNPNPNPTPQYTSPKGLRLFSKLTSWTTLFLIFVGGMVKSTNSGLAVPDWPLSYGTLFPPMVGGIFYEHGHRMVATLVGFMTLCLAIALTIKEPRRWVKNVGYLALFAVIVQGVLGGITVLFFLPTAISVSHGVLAQTFFLITIFLAYSLSNERQMRGEEAQIQNNEFIKFLLFFIFLIYCQLVLGALTRHTEAGLAIYDFPTMAGYWVPTFNEDMLARINDWRFEQNLDYVNQTQVIVHFAHRIGAIVITVAICILNWLGLKYYAQNRKVLITLFVLDFLIFVQVVLGISTVLSIKEPITTSLHVVNGAGILGISFLLLLRSTPTSWREAQKLMFQ